MQTAQEHKKHGGVMTTCFVEYLKSAQKQDKNNISNINDNKDEDHKSSNDNNNENKNDEDDHDIEKGKSETQMQPKIVGIDELALNIRFYLNKESKGKRTAEEKNCLLGNVHFQPCPPRDKQNKKC